MGRVDDRFLIRFGVAARRHRRMRFIMEAQMVIVEREHQTKRLLQTKTFPI